MSDLHISFHITTSTCRDSVFTVLLYSVALLLPAADGLLPLPTLAVLLPEFLAAAAAAISCASRHPLARARTPIQCTHPPMQHPYYPTIQHSHAALYLSHFYFIIIYSWNVPPFVLSSFSPPSSLVLHWWIVIAGKSLDVEKQVVAIGNWTHFSPQHNC